LQSPELVNLLKQCTEMREKNKSALIIKLYFSIFYISMPINNKYICLIVSFLIIFQYCGKNRNEGLTEATNYLRQAEGFINKSDYGSAIENFRLAAQGFEELRLDSNAGQVYMSIAECQRNIGEYDSVCEYYMRAKKSFYNFGNRSLERGADLALAEFYLSLGEIDDAFYLANSGYASVKIFHDTANIFRAQNIIASVYSRRRDYNNEIAALKELFQLDSAAFKNQHNDELTKKMLIVKIKAGEINDAAKIFHEVIEDFRNRSLSNEIVKTYLLMGSLLFELGKIDTAFGIYSDALGEINQQTDKILQIEILCGLGCAAYSKQQFQDARRYLVDANAITKNVNCEVYSNFVRLMTTACDRKLSIKHRSQADTLLAEQFRKIRESFINLKFSRGEILSALLQAKTESRNDSIKVIYEKYKKIVELTNWNESEIDRFTNITSSVLIKTEFSNGINPIIEYYCRNHDAASAWRVSEYASSFEIANNFLKTSFLSGQNPLETALKRYRWLINSRTAIQSQIDEEIISGKKLRNQIVALLLERFHRLENEISIAQNDLLKINRNVKCLAVPEDYSLHMIQDSINNSNIVVKYLPLKDSLYFLVLQKDTSIIISKEIVRGDLQALANEYNSLIRKQRNYDDAPNSYTEYLDTRIEELQKVLGYILLNPLRDIVSKYNLLSIILPEEFGFLPVHTLKIDGNYLIEKIDVSYMPYSTAFLFDKKKEATVRNVVAAGNPGTTLWDVEYELNDIRSFYDSVKIYTGGYATISNINKTDNDILHLSVDIQGADPELQSFSMILAGDSPPHDNQNITSIDILQIKPAQICLIVDLSDTPGRYFREIPLTFLANSSLTVVQTVWSIDRRTKKYFNEMFYTSLKNGVVITELYRSAVIAMINNPEYRDTRKWGCYFRFGK
jgi:tetratricopeptide (TPR) repeat protein